MFHMVELATKMVAFPPEGIGLSDTWEVQYSEILFSVPGEDEDPDAGPYCLPCRSPPRPTRESFAASLSMEPRIQWYTAVLCGPGGWRGCKPFNDVNMGAV